MLDRHRHISEEFAKIIDKFPVESYPPELREKITDDLRNLKDDFETGVVSLMNQEDKDIISAVQHLLGLLRIDIDDLSNREPKYKS